MKKVTKIKNLVRKLVAVIAICIFNVFGFLNCVNAAQLNENEIRKVKVYRTEDCVSLLKYKGIAVKVIYLEYTENGQKYPAYCLDKTKPGAEAGAYEVSVNDAIKDVGLWRVIINGYPYKTIEELGVANRDEAYTATKQAVYCYIHKNNPADYEGIGEAGQRTLNAMNKIINNAKNSTETKISNTININREQEQWEIDNIDKEYVSKIFSVKTIGKIDNYKIKLTKENAQNLGGIKVTDEKNNEKSEFKSNEKFKVLVPIKNMTEERQIKIEAMAKIKTKPVLYGKSLDSKYQDYALATATYEDGTGIISEKYLKNETKIIIQKKEEETNKKLPGVEFELLNEKQEIVYSGLKTDENGRIIIENLLPGIYYLREVNGLDGYEKYDELIKIDLDLNQQITVTVNNRKEEEPKLEIDKKEQTVSNKVVKKLPVTGF